jgi:DtxR family Mn-dependent transcriptional regulator
MAGYHAPVEEYLETIIELEEAGIPAMRARLVERLGVSAPAVSEMVARLEKDGYLSLDKHRLIRLSETGRAFATAVMRRHRLAERLLTDILGVPWWQVHEEACRLEHAISDDLEAYLVAHLKDPSTCPHGNPIPGAAKPAPVHQLMPLAEVAHGAKVIVRRIDEELEGQRGPMKELFDAGLLPGTKVQVSVLEGGRVMVETTGGAPLELSERPATLIYVSAA